VRSFLAEDVLLAGYAGLMLGPVIYMTRWLAVTFGGTGGLLGHLAAEHYGVFVVGSLLVGWCGAHWVLPLPSLVVAIGLRLERPWSTSFGRLLGVFLLVLPPIGSVLGLWLLYRIPRGRAVLAIEECK
jgi:hypothetical protein